MTKFKMPSGLRAGLCALLLTLLAVCGYVGAKEPETAAVSLPIVRSTLEGAQDMVLDAQDTRAKLALERAQEIEMLDSVIASKKAGAATVESALAQKTELVRRMEAEAQAEAVLGEMGFEDVTAVCGAQMLTLIVPKNEADGEADRAKILSAASGQTGIPAESVKIILVKNGTEDCADGENLLY